MKYKLLALDLDGTLLNSNGRIPEKHKEAIKKAQAQGIVIVIATGRYYMQTEWIINELDFKGILVSNDGTATINTETKELINEFSYSIDDVALLIHYCREYNIHYSVCTAFNYYIEVVNDFIEEHHKKYGITHTFHEDVLKLEENLMKFTINDYKRIGGWQDLETPNLRIKTDNEFFKEFVHPKSNKTNSLIKVLELLKIKPCEMVAIGDFYNDVGMLEYAGLGIAMGNAPNDVKQRADKVTLSNDEGGIYDAIEKYMLNH